MQFLDAKIKIKSCDQNGEIFGYASVFNVTDGYNDVTVKGAFQKAVHNFNTGIRPKLLWQHDINSPIGIIEELYEDDHGLFVKCQLLLEIEKAKEIYTLLRKRAIDGFSIGYKLNDSYYENGKRFLTDIDLLEISIVTFPACREAVVETIKSKENKLQNNERNKTMNEMQNEIEQTISELNTFVEENDQEIRRKGMSLPLSKISENDNRNISCKKADFLEYIRGGSDVMLKKSLNGSNGTNGGHFIPDEVVENIHDRMKLLSPMRSIAKSIRISTNSVDILVDSKEPEVGWAGDDTEINETSTPEIRKIKITAHEIYAKPKANQKLLDDSRINIEEWLISKISEKIAALENAAFVNGDGNDKPRGFLTYETDDTASFGKIQHFKTGVDGDFGSNSTAVNLLIDMTCSIKPYYAKNAKWIMSRSALARIRKLKTNDGTALWQPAMTEASPSMLLGYPVILDDDMPELREGTKSTSIAFGDFYSGYQIVDRCGLKILRDPYTSKPFVEFYASKRTGGDVIDFDAIKVLKFEA